ncbi:MAG: hypothetical protein H6810_04130 [Phycisphaeraceae bacterium]|nr:MAG: hypothetical protein H6810_04130 [Phycisphaeraceae bacterium]
MRGRAQCLVLLAALAGLVGCGSVPCGTYPAYPTSVPLDAYADRIATTDIGPGLAFDVVGLRRVRGGLHIDLLWETPPGRPEPDLYKMAQIRCLVVPGGGDEPVPMKPPRVKWCWDPTAPFGTMYKMAPTDRRMYPLTPRGETQRWLVIQGRLVERGASIPNGEYSVEFLYFRPDDTGEGEGTPVSGTAGPFVLGSILQDSPGGANQPEG